MPASDLRKHGDRAQLAGLRPWRSYATPCIKRTNHASEPVPGPESWLLSATSQSGHSAWPDAPTSPKPRDGPDALWTAPSPSSDSHHDLGMAVAQNLSASLVS